jgi:hypothetical protein
VIKYSFLSLCQEIKRMMAPVKTAATIMNESTAAMLIGFSGT